MNYRDAFHTGLSFDEYIATTEKHADLWRGIYARAEVDAEEIERVESTERQWHLLVISEDWCGDAVNTVPVVARLAEQARNIEMRVISRDANLDIMDRHLSPTGARAIPVVIVLDENFDEVGWWGSRPAEMQTWFSTAGKSMEKTARYRHMRGWYARDRGRSTVAELLSIICTSAVA